MRINRFLHPSLQVRIAGLFVLVILVVLFIVGLSFSRIVLNSIEREEGNNALEIARLISTMSTVQESMKSSTPSVTLQSLTQQYQELTKTKFIVIINNEGIRYTHPNNDLIGKMFTGGDEGPALRGEEYISKANGISGPSIRAFAPIFDPDTQRQLGAVVVGMYEKNLFSIVQEYTSSIISWLLVGLLVGIIASLLLSRSIKRILYGLEPDQIARLFKEREVLLQSLCEGVIAVDKESRITLINNAARKILSINENAVGQEITNIVENSTLPRVLQTEQPEKDIELSVNGVTVLSNRIPIKVGGKIVGAVSTFRDMTEVRILAEELTGVKRYVEGLRAKTHEFMNKLQTISGLLELQNYEEAKQYIKNTTILQQQLLEFLNRHILDPRTSGLLLGKIQQAQELNIEVTITPGSHLNPLPMEIPSDLVVLILGNLIENAMEALKGRVAGEISVCILDDVDGVTLIVEDNGPGIPALDLPQIFEKGYSTKGDQRGYGLYLVKSQVESIVRGKVTLHSVQDEGTCFIVQLPKKGHMLRRLENEHSYVNR